MACGWKKGAFKRQNTMLFTYGKIKTPAKNTKKKKYLNSLVLNVFFFKKASKQA